MCWGDGNAPWHFREAKYVRSISCGNPSLIKFFLQDTVCCLQVTETRLFVLIRTAVPNAMPHHGVLSYLCTAQNSFVKVSRPEGSQKTKTRKGSSLCTSPPTPRLRRTSVSQCLSTYAGAPADKCGEKSNAKSAMVAQRTQTVPFPRSFSLPLKSSIAILLFSIRLEP
jgi:hypothetical protein